MPEFVGVRASPEAILEATAGGGTTGSRALLHRLTIGHFDVAALHDRKLVVLRPLEMDVVARLLGEFGEATEGGNVHLGGRAVEIKEGHIICPWLMPWRIPGAEAFARQLCQETGCVMFDATLREVVAPERLGQDSGLPTIMD